MSIIQQAVQLYNAHAELLTQENGIKLHRDTLIALFQAEPFNRKPASAASLYNSAKQAVNGPAAEKTPKAPKAPKAPKEQAEKDSDEEILYSAVEVLDNDVIGRVRCFMTVDEAKASATHNGRNWTVVMGNPDPGSTLVRDDVLASMAQ